MIGIVRVKRHYLFFTICLLVVVSVLAFILSSHHNTTQLASSEQAVIFTFNDVAMVEFSDSMRLVEASTVHYFVAQDRYHASRVNVTTYSTADRSIPLHQLFSGNIHYFPDAQYITLNDPVNLFQYEGKSTITLTAKSATYDLQKQQLTSQDPIHIHSPEGQTSANNLYVDFLQNSFQLFEQVNSVFTLPTEAP